MTAVTGTSQSGDRSRPVLVVDDLRTWIPTKHGTVRAVDGVSLELHRGQTLAVVGESGSGKSVLARSILNLLPKGTLTPTGSVHLNGVDLRAQSRRRLRSIWGRDVAMIFQDPMTSLNPVMRVERQLTEGLVQRGELPRRERHRKALELLGHVGIPDPERRARAFPHEMSGGMRQRIGIASAIAGSPSLLIADEPTTALDVTVQRQVLDLLQSLQERQGMAMMLITHDLAVVAGRADVVAVMYAGRVVEVGPTEVLFAAAKHPYTRALLDSIPRLTAPSHTRLQAIPGLPARAVGARIGCAFAPRCARASERCRVNDPALVAGPAGQAQAYACFNPVLDAARVDTQTRDDVEIGA